MGERTRTGQFAEGNAAARSHGAYSFFALGRMPKGCRSIRDALAKMRSCLEAEARRGPDGALTADRAALIHSACLHEGRRRLLAWWLARKGDGLTTAEFIRLQADAAAALEARDRCLARLGLAGESGLDLADLFRPPERPAKPDGLGQVG